MKDIELPPRPAAVGIKLRLFRWALLSGDRQSADHHLIDLKKAIDDHAYRAVEADRAQRVPDGYDQGSAECMASVQEILDGKDRGDGVANEPWESIRRRLIALVAPAPAQQEPSEAEMVCAEAYQVVGCLLSDLGLFETEQARKILDNLSAARRVHQDVLPWESAAQHQEQPQQERGPMTREQVRGLMETVGYEAATPQEKADFINGIRHAERHHGIRKD